MSYAKEDVKEHLELEDIFNLLEYLGAKPEMFPSHIIAYTICHGGDAHKLYYYDNTQLFQCYTQCGSFDIFELVQKVKHIDDLNKAIYFVVNFFNLQGAISETDEDEYTYEDWKIFNRYAKIGDMSWEEQKKIELPQFDKNILKYLPQPRILNWEEEGILKEICDYMDIHYDPADGNILIPHKDENGNLIGIRQRTLVQENEQYGKYRPWREKQQLYNHPLAFNLYGLNVAKEHIKKMQTAIVVESEKAVLQYMSYFGTTNNICVAVCGSSLSKYQLQLLQEYGAKELVIAFDKDFHEIGDKDYEQVVNKLIGLNRKYGAEINLSFIFDEEGTRLGYKDSPLDCGRDTFLYLFRNRVIL